MIVANQDVTQVGWLTRERLMLWGSAFAFASLIYLGINLPYVVVSTGDFAINYTGANVALWGHAAAVYDNSVFGSGLGPKVVGWKIGPYANPPFALLFVLPLALLPFIVALIAWTLAGAGLCLALLSRLVGWRVASLAVLGAPAAFFNLYFAQTGFFSAGLLAGGLLVMERRPIVAGICFGSLAYKPQLGLLLPVALAAGGYLRVFVSATATIAVLVIASLALFGSVAWIAFFHQIEFLFHGNALVMAPSIRSVTVYQAARVMGTGRGFALTMQAVSAICAAVVIIIIWRRPATMEVRSAAVVTATFLATFYALDYDTVILIFAAAWLWRAGIQTGFLPWEQLATVTLLICPALAIISGGLLGVPFGPVALWLILLVLLRRAMSEM